MDSATNQSVVENVYGPNYSKVEQLHQKLEQISWFSNVEKETSIEAQIEWKTREEGIQVLSNASFAPILDELNDKLTEQARQLGISAQMERARDDRSEELFHNVFDAAFEVFEQDGSEVVKKVCENVMLSIGCLCSYAAVNVLEKEATELLDRLLSLLEAGYAPISIENNQITAI